MTSYFKYDLNHFKNEMTTKLGFVLLLTTPQVHLGVDVDINCQVMARVVVVFFVSTVEQG